MVDLGGRCIEWTQRPQKRTSGSRIDPNKKKSGAGGSEGPPPMRILIGHRGVLPDGDQKIWWWAGHPQRIKLGGVPTFCKGLGIQRQGPTRPTYPYKLCSGPSAPDLGRVAIGATIAWPRTNHRKVSREPLHFSLRQRPPHHLQAPLFLSSILSFSFSSLSISLCLSFSRSPSGGATGGKAKARGPHSSAGVPSVQRNGQ